MSQLFNQRSDYNMIIFVIKKIPQGFPDYLKNLPFFLVFQGLSEPCSKNQSLEAVEFLSYFSYSSIYQQVGNLEGFYHFKHKRASVRSKRSIKRKTQKLVAEDAVSYIYLIFFLDKVIRDLFLI